MNRNCVLLTGSDSQQLNHTSPFKIYSDLAFKIYSRFSTPFPPFLVANHKFFERKIYISCMRPELINLCELDGIPTNYNCFLDLEKGILGNYECCAPLFLLYMRFNIGKLYKRKSI